MGRFKPGQSGNPAGRKPGAKNKTSEELRSVVQAFIEANWQKVQADFNALKPGERLAFLNNLLRHVLPEPITPDRLTEEQLEQLHTYLKKKYSDE